MNSPFCVSILICVHNEEKNIATLLISLSHQTAFTKIKEVLLADNNSTDYTVSLAKEIAQTYQLPLRVIPLNENNIGRARRLLVQEASEDFVAFVDGDCRVESTWLQTLLSHFSNLAKDESLLAGVGGPNRTPGKNFFQKTLNANLDRGWLHGYSSQAHRTSKLLGAQVDHLPTTNALFLKDAILAAGNFSDSFAKVGEDLDLGLRIVRQGYQLRSFSTPIVINDCAENVWDWAQRMFRFGSAQGLTLGRRFSFVTFSLALGTALLGALLVSPAARSAHIGLVIFSVLVLVSKSAPRRQFQSYKLVQTGASFLYAPVIYGITVLSYFFGFYWGTARKIKALYKN